MLFLSASSFLIIKTEFGERGDSPVVKVLCYKSEGRRFDPSWCHWDFSLTLNPSDRTRAAVPNLFDSRSPFRINFYGGAPLGLPYVLQVNGV